MCILYPLSGGYYTLASRFLDPSYAFAMGWNYWLQWAVTLPLEITVAGQTVQWWTDKVPLGAWITIFWLVISTSREVSILEVLVANESCLFFV